MTILSSSNSELVYVCLCHIDVLLSKVPKLFEQEYRSFFSRYGGGSGDRRLGWVIYTVLNIVTSSNYVMPLYRGYYTVAPRYEFYFRVAKQYFTNECSE